MSFISLILKNVFRHRGRTVLTAIGVSLGIATIIVFGFISRGIDGSVSSLLRRGGTDLTVARAGSPDIVLSFLSDEQIKTILKVETVEAVIPTVISFSASGKNPFFTTFGLDQSQLDLAGVRLFSGRPYENDDQVIIGKLTARNKSLGLNDELEIKEKKYQIVGIFESGLSFQNAGAILTISEARKIQGITDKVNLAAVKVKEGKDSKTVAQEIEAADRDLVAIVETDDFEAARQFKNIGRQIGLTISLIAIFIGGIGVMNTIIMSVFERTREIGLLRAVGWPAKRVVQMILFESVVIGLIAFLFGSVFGLLLVWLIGHSELGQAWFSFDYQAIVFAQALLVSLAIVLLGSSYPAFKASKLEPSEALRHE